MASIKKININDKIVKHVDIVCKFVDPINANNMVPNNINDTKETIF